MTRAEYMAARQSRARAAGLCIQCCKRPHNGTSRCSQCAERRRDRTAKLRDDARRAGLCEWCMREPAGETVLCSACALKRHPNRTPAERRAELYWRRRNVGQCVTCCAPAGRYAECFACRMTESKRRVA